MIGIWDLGFWELGFPLRVGVVGLFCVVSSVILILLVKKMCGLRVSEKEEKEGLDLAEHGMDAYADFRIE